MSGSREQVEAYLKWLYIRARDMLNQPHNWKAVEALAAALLEEKRIGSKRAREIILEAFRLPGEKPRS